MDSRPLDGGMTLKLTGGTIRSCGELSVAKGLQVPIPNKSSRCVSRTLEVSWISLESRKSSSPSFSDVPSWCKTRQWSPLVCSDGPDGRAFARSFCFAWPSTVGHDSPHLHLQPPGTGVVSVYPCIRVFVYPFVIFNPVTLAKLCSEVLAQ